MASCSTGDMQHRAEASRRGISVSDSRLIWARRGAWRWESGPHRLELLQHQDAPPHARCLTTDATLQPLLAVARRGDARGSCSAVAGAAAHETADVYSQNEHPFYAEYTTPSATETPPRTTWRGRVACEISTRSSHGMAFEKWCWKRAESCLPHRSSAVP